MDDNRVTFYPWTESFHTRVSDTHYEDTVFTFCFCPWLAGLCWAGSSSLNLDFLIVPLSCLVSWNETMEYGSICRHKTHSHLPVTLSLLIFFFFSLQSKSQKDVKMDAPWNGIGQSPRMKGTWLSWQFHLPLVEGSKLIWFVSHWTCPISEVDSYCIIVCFVKHHIIFYFMLCYLYVCFVCVFCYLILVFHKLYGLEWGIKFCLKE